MLSTLVDIVVPAFNAEKTIRSALESLQKQTITDIRIIVANDGSTDGTAEIVRQMALDDPRILLLDGPHEGITAVRNRGLAVCEAEFIACHDSDDLAFPTRLESQLSYLRRNPDCIAVGCNVEMIDENGDRTGKRSYFRGDVKPNARSFPSAEPYLMHPFLLVRRSAVVAVGGYRHIFAEDTDLYWRLFDIGRLHNLSDILGHYRIHEKSISSASIGNGRVASLSSQLAAISYERRRSGVADFDFTSEFAKSLRNATSFSETIALASQDLTAPEKDYLKVASSAKLLSLLMYRPYLPTLEDCRLISDTLTQNKALVGDSDWKTIQRSLGFVSLRLISAGKWKEARALRAPLASSLRALLSRIAGEPFKRFKARRNEKK